MSLFYPLCARLWRLVYLQQHLNTSSCLICDTDLVPGLETYYYCCYYVCVYVYVCYALQVLQLLERNVQQNGLGGSVTVQKLDWRGFDLTETFDVILASDVLYHMSQAEVGLYVSLCILVT